MVNAADSDTYERFRQGNIDACNVAPHDFADILRENVMPIAPAGMSNVTLCDGSVTGANEGAIAHAMSTYAQNHGRKAGSVLGFENASHGNSVATLSVSDSRVNTACVAGFSLYRYVPGIYVIYSSQESKIRLRYDHFAIGSRCAHLTYAC